VIRTGSDISTQKRDDVAWNGITRYLQKKKKARNVLTEMGTESWDAEGCILVDFLPKEETFNAAHYIQMFKKLRSAFRETRQMKRPSSFNTTTHDLKLRVRRRRQSQRMIGSVPGHTTQSGLAPLRLLPIRGVRNHMETPALRERDTVQEAVRS
jgi:hypothetical protein